MPLEAPSISFLRLPSHFCVKLKANVQYSSLLNLKHALQNPHFVNVHFIYITKAPMSKLVFQDFHMGTYGLVTLCENIQILSMRIKDKKERTTLMQEVKCNENKSLKLLLCL